MSQEMSKWCGGAVDEFGEAEFKQAGPRGLRKCSPPLEPAFTSTTASGVLTSVTRNRRVTGRLRDVHLAEHLDRISLLEYIETYYVIDSR